MKYKHIDVPETKLFKGIQKPFWKPEIQRAKLIEYVTSIYPLEVVVDVGACIGDWSVAFSSIYNFPPTIYALEPIYYFSLVERSKEHPNIHAVPYGLSDQSELRDFDLSMCPRFSKGSGYKVRCFSWIDFVEIYHLKEVDLMKVDIEGGEREIFETIETLLPHYIEMEFHHGDLSDKVCFPNMQKEFKDNYTLFKKVGKAYIYKSKKAR